MQILRELMVKWAIQDKGRPYIWGGDDTIAGFDCSGYCVEHLKSVGMLPRKGDWSAAMLALRWPRSRGNFGNLVFWENQKGEVIHVEICIGNGLAIGASGGGSKTTSLAAAIRHNAFVKIRPINSRANVWGFVDPFQKEIKSWQN